MYKRIVFHSICTLLLGCSPDNGTGPPVVTGVVPNPAERDQIATAQGDSLIGVESVQIGQEATTPISVSDNAIRFIVPATAVSADMTLVTADSRSNSIFLNIIEPRPSTDVAPTVNKLEPDQINPGSLVTATGQALLRISSVFWGNIPIPISEKSDEKLQFFAPETLTSTLCKQTKDLYLGYDDGRIEIDMEIEWSRPVIQSWRINTERNRLTIEGQSLANIRASLRGLELVRSEGLPAEDNRADFVIPRMIDGGTAKLIVSACGSDETEVLIPPTPPIVHITYPYEPVAAESILVAYEHDKPITQIMLNGSIIPVLDSSEQLGFVSTRLPPDLDVGPAVISLSDADGGIGLFTFDIVAEVPLELGVVPVARIPFVPDDLAGRLPLGTSAFPQTCGVANCGLEAGRVVYAFNLEQCERGEDGQRPRGIGLTGRAILGTIPNPPDRSQLIAVSTVQDGFIDALTGEVRFTVTTELSDAPIPYFGTVAAEFDSRQITSRITIVAFSQATGRQMWFEYSGPCEGTHPDVPELCSTLISTEHPCR